MTQRRAKQAYSEEQKKQLIELFNHGKPRSEIIREYNPTPSTFDKWVRSTQPAPATRRITAPRRNWSC